MNKLIKFVEAEDQNLDVILDIYNYYIKTTTATFDLDIISLDEFKNRISFHNTKYITLLIYFDKELIGFSFLTKFNGKEAYDKTVELGLYLKTQFTGKGIGVEIIYHMEKLAKEKSFNMLIASVSDENINSIKLFRKLGYNQCAHYQKIAEKFGRKVGFIDFQKELI